MILIPRFLDYQNVGLNNTASMGKTITGRKKSLDDPVYYGNTIGRFGCLFTALFNVGNDIKARNIESKAPSVKVIPNSRLTDYNANDSYFDFTPYVWKGSEEDGYYENDANMLIGNMRQLISDMSGIDISLIKITKVTGSSKIASELYSVANDSNRKAYVIGGAKNRSNPSHFFNILATIKSSISKIHDVYKGNYSEFEQNVKNMKVNEIYIIEIEGK